MWELDLSLDNIVASWPGAAKDRLVDFLLKRSSPSGKRLLFNLLQQLVSFNVLAYLPSRGFMAFDVSGAARNSVTCVVQGFSHAKQVAYFAAVSFFSFFMTFICLLQGGIRR